MEPISTFTSKTVVLPHDDIDTDQIVPARFLVTTTREGLGEAAFADWRYDDGGQPVADFPLNRPEAEGARVLVAGNNFGCGSSREHAPWALLDYGFRAVVSTEFADIFRNNSLKNGLLPILVGRDVHGWLVSNPGVDVTINLEATTITMGNGESTTFPIDRFSRYCLLNGIDQFGYLMQQEKAISDYEDTRAWPI